MQEHHVRVVTPGAPANKSALRCCHGRNQSCPKFEQPWVHDQQVHLGEYRTLLSDSEAPPRRSATGVKSRLKRTALFVFRPHYPTTSAEDATGRITRYSQGHAMMESLGTTRSTRGV